MAALTMQSLKDYVRGGETRSVAQGTVLLDITHNLLKNNYVEIPFLSDWTILRCKEKIYTMMGTQIATMQLSLNNVPLNDETRTLGSYNPRHSQVLHVIDNDPFSHARGGGLENVNLIKKYEMSREDYEKRNNTYLAYKKKKIAENPNWKSIYQVKNKDLAHAESTAATRERISVGMRCEVLGGRRGEVKFVGEIPALTLKSNGGVETATNQKAPAAAAEEKESTDAAEVQSVVGKHVTIEDETTAKTEEEPKEPFVQLWIGVIYDEPVGKNDGEILGKRYFQANKNCGGFIKPECVKVGDYPEKDPFASDDEDEEKEGEDLLEEL